MADTTGSCGTSPETAKKLRHEATNAELIKMNECNARENEQIYLLQQFMILMAELKESELPS